MRKIFTLLAAEDASLGQSISLNSDSEHRTLCISTANGHIKFMIFILHIRVTGCSPFAFDDLVIFFPPSGPQSGQKSLDHSHQLIIKAGLQDLCM